MKILVKSALVVMLSMFMVGASAQTKQKFGHINSNDLLQVMPERDAAEKALQAEADAMEKQLQSMQVEYKRKYDEATQLPEGTSELVLNTIREELVGMEQRIQEFQGNASNALQKKEAELLEPIISKAREAIEKVAKENGYTYIFDSGVGVLLYQPESDDILPLVKKELGIVTPTATSSE